MTSSKNGEGARKSAFYGQVSARDNETSNVYKICYSDDMCLNLCQVFSYD